MLTYARRGWGRGLAAVAVAALVLAGCSSPTAGTSHSTAGSSNQGTAGSSAGSAAGSGAGNAPGSGAGNTGGPADAAPSPPTTAAASSAGHRVSSGPAASTTDPIDTSLRDVADVPGAPTDCTLPARTSAASVPSDGVPVFVALVPPMGRDAAHPRATVVMSNESDQDLCSWLPVTRTLRRNGFAVALYNYQGPPVGTIAAITGWLRQQSGTPVVLMGASKGAKASIIAGAELVTPPAAVVALSAEASLMGVAVAPAAAELSSPTLLVTAKHDLWGSAQADRHFATLAPHGVATLLVVQGQQHGTHLLHGRVPGTIIDFLESHVGADSPTGSPGPPSPAAPSTSTPPGSSTPADAPMGCPLGDTHTDDRYIAGPAGSRIQLESIGSGPVAAVFLHEKGTRGMCGFAGYAAWLAGARHVRSVLFDRCGYGQTACPAKAPTPWDLTAAVVSWARAHGAHRVVLVGASAGGGDALVAAARIRPPVDAVVDLSGDDGDGAHMTAAARTLTMPVLYAVAVDDALCPVSTMRSLLRATPGHDSTLTVVRSSPGSHGWDLLPGTSGGATWSPLATAIAHWITG